MCRVGRQPSHRDRIVVGTLLRDHLEPILFSYQWSTRVCVVDQIKGFLGLVELDLARIDGHSEGLSLCLRWLLNKKDFHLNHILTDFTGIERFQDEQVGRVKAHECVHLVRVDKSIGSLSTVGSAVTISLGFAH